MQLRHSCGLTIVQSRRCSPDAGCKCCSSPSALRQFNAAHQMLFAHIACTAALHLPHCCVSQMLHTACRMQCSSSPAALLSFSIYACRLLHSMQLFSCRTAFIKRCSPNAVCRRSLNHTNVAWQLLYAMQLFSCRTAALLLFLGC